MPDWGHSASAATGDADMLTADVRAKAEQHLQNAIDEIARLEGANPSPASRAAAYLELRRQHRDMWKRFLAQQ